MKAYGIAMILVIALIGCDDDQTCSTQVTKILSVEQDARISVKPADPNEANSNYGDFEGITAQAQTSNLNPVQYRGLLEFDLSSIASGSTIDKAELSLFYNLTSIHFQSSQSGSNACNLQRVVTDWDESSVTWNTQPDVTTINQVTLAQSISTTQDYVDIDVTQLIQDMVDDPSESHGFLLRLITEIEYRKMIFASSDHASAGLQPRLVVTYTTP
ncbi:MAG: DNRLRE domain-containing protein [Bacteroidetes bacterium]|nr:DNRLRE domain-containing protein [Bacteroidota bacterium]